MIIELVGISVSNKNRQELGKALATLVGPIQVQPGCLSCRLSQSLPQQDSLQIETRWESQEDLIRHLQSDGYKRLLLLMELSTAPPVLEFLSVLEVRGLDLVETARCQSQ
jgi:quinol monooxygenase YgiN